MAGLTADRVQKLREAGRYGDGNGLYLLVKPTGTKSWVQRVRVNGKRTDKGLGGYPALTLLAARRLAVANQAALDSGKNPWAKAETIRAVKAHAATRGRESQPPTFRAAAKAVHAANLSRWRSDTYGVSWLRSMERHVLPAIGDLRIDDITRRDVLNVLVPIWSEKHETARQLRGQMAMTFRWAMGYGYRADNPAGEAVAAALPRMAKVKEHRKALPYSEVPGVMAGLKRDRGNHGGPAKATLLSLRFLILTAARTIEVRRAKWDEVDMAGGLWTVPARMMKAGKRHRVPLSRQALDVLALARDELGVYGDGLLFPAPSGNPLGDNTLGQRLHLDRVDCVPHGFRSSFRDWAAEQTTYSREAVELSLAHTPGNSAEMAYFRSDLLDQRRELMQAWADYLDGA